MLYLILQEDDPDVPAASRLDARDAHRDYLEANRHRVVLASPMLGGDDDERLGSMTLLRADDAAEARAYIDGDPFTAAGLFATTRIVRVRSGYASPGALEAAMDDG